MKWLLVYLFFTNGVITSQEIDKFDIMTDCFEVRENMIKSMNSKDGYFPINHQAICISRLATSLDFCIIATRNAMLKIQISLIGYRLSTNTSF
jgi:hypothetical protein